MSRYLSQLTRETRSKLRPPSSLRLAPRAAVYREIHEERLVTPAPSELHHPVDPAPAPPPPGHEIAAPHMTPQAEAPQPAARPLPSQASPRLADSVIGPPREPKVDLPRLLSRPAETISQPAAEAPVPRPAARERSPIAERPLASPAVAKAEERPNLQDQSAPEIDREIVETTVRSEFFPPDDSRPRTKAPASPEFVIPEPVRQWFHADPERPAPAAAPRPAPTPALAFQPAPRPTPQPVIDVTIDKVEVILESEPHAPRLAVRRPDPRGAAPARPAPPPGAGRLARQYLDR